MEPKQPFQPHPNLSNEINSNISQSEVECGVFTKDMPVGTVLSVRTRNTTYTIERRTDGFYISGCTQRCPEPIPVKIIGSTWGGSMIKVGFIGRGMHMELFANGQTIVTSSVQDITEVQ